MTTPAQWRKYHEAAEAYVYFLQTSMALCKQIRSLKGGVRIEGEAGPEREQALALAASIAGAVETEMKKALMPYVERLEKLSISITDRLPKPPGSIVLPGDSN
jgi:hypothetical protein